jgi:hypothetical protein
MAKLFHGVFFLRRLTFHYAPSLFFLRLFSFLELTPPPLPPFHDCVFFLVSTHVVGSDACFYR